MPICHLIGVRSHGCPITGVRFELIIIGYLQLDTHMIYTSITHVLMAFFAMFLTILKRAKNIFTQKYFCSKKTLLISKFVIDMNN